LFVIPEGDLLSLHAQKHHLDQRTHEPFYVVILNAVKDPCISFLLFLFVIPLGTALRGCSFQLVILSAAENPAFCPNSLAYGHAFSRAVECPALKGASAP
jgi:hypothetical protein